MNFIPKEIEDYALKQSSEENEVLAELNRETHTKILMPRMLAGHLQGNFIKMLSAMIKPQTILEVGTYTGYSAICWAYGLQKNGMVHTIDVNEELEDIAQKYIHKARLEEKIKLHIGHALDIIPELHESFDVVYLDADKENYCNYYDLVFPKLKVGGYIIADNALWSGKVLSPATQKDKETYGIQQFNAKVTQDNSVFNMLLPIRDGLMIIQKLTD